MLKRILVVEDTDALRENINESLRMEGYATWCAPNGEVALDIIEQANPDLIITDLLMPVMNGFDFIKNVRGNPRWNNVPILVFSAMPPLENQKIVLDLGASFYLKKPGTLDLLLIAVKNLIQL